MARHGRDATGPLPPGTHDAALDLDASFDTDFGDLAISQKKNDTDPVRPATDVGHSNRKPPVRNFLHLISNNKSSTIPRLAGAAAVNGHKTEQRSLRNLVRPRKTSAPNSVSGPQIPDNVEVTTAPRAASFKDSLLPLRKTELTIILVGETGVGKSCFMSLLANVCAGRSILHFKPEHNPNNVTKLPESQSQTKAAMLYEMERPDGVRVRVLDTPGLCDTRGIEQDAEHKASIANAIRDHVVQVDAVIVMANGTNKRLTVPTDYALNTLSAMFPASIASNICFLFSNVDNPLTFNFSTSTLPAALQDAELFMLQNPLALLVNYQAFKNKERAMRASQAQAYENLLEETCKATIDMLNDMFKWADERTSQPTADISRLYNVTVGIEATIADVIARLDQMEAKKNELQVLAAGLETSEQIMRINEQFQQVMSREMHIQANTPDSHTTQCTVAGCYNNCHRNCNLEFLLDPAELGRRCEAFWKSREDALHADPLDERCTVCGHEARDHRHFHSVWALQTMEELVIDEQARQSYTSAMQSAVAHENKMLLIASAAEKLNAEIEQLEQRLNQLCTEFHQVALTGSFVGHIAATVRLLELRRESKRATGDVDGERALTKTIESFQAKVRVLQDVERKKEAKWSFTRLASAIADRLPRIRWT